MIQRSIDRVDTDFHLSCMIWRESPCMTFLQSRIPNLNRWRNMKIYVNYLPPAERQSQKEPPESPSSYQRSRKEKLYSKDNLYNGHILLALTHHHRKHHNYHHNHIIVATAKIIATWLHLSSTLARISWLGSLSSSMYETPTFISQVNLQLSGLENLSRIIFCHPPGHGVDLVLLFEHSRHQVLTTVLLHIIMPAVLSRFESETSIFPEYIDSVSVRKVEWL